MARQNNASYEGQGQRKIKQITALDRILEQPTAYNVDEVVARLEKKIQTHEHCIEYEKKNGTITEEFQQRKAVEVLNDAIEIVRGGGVWN